MKKISLLVFFSTIVLSIYAQNLRVKFEHVSLIEGLSQSSVSDIVQDSKGFMWFSTLDGLNKYDGYEIEIYYNTKDEGAITDNVIKCLYETPDEENPILWVGTADHGLCKYDRLTDKFISISKETTSNGLNSNSIKAISGNNNILWVGTNNGLNKFEQATQKWTNYSTENSNISNNMIHAIHADINENLWIASDEGLLFFDVNLEKFTIYKKENGLPSNNIRCIEIDIYNNIWIGTAEGISYFDIENKTFINYSTKNGLGSNNVKAIVQDHEGIIWIGTISGGLNRFDPVDKTFTVVKHDPTDRFSLSINSILSIYPDKSNILWVGTSLGGINKWNRAAENLFLFRHNPYEANSLSSNLVRNIYQDKEGVIWIATVDGGLNKQDIKTDKFISYKHNSNDATSISNNHVRIVLEDSDNNFWLGTEGSGINIFDREKEKVVKKYQYDENNPKSLSSNRIWRIIEDHKKRILIATMGGGLNIFNSETEDFKSYNFDKNNNKTISSNQVTTVFEDSKNRIWVGTTNGFNQFFPKTEEFIRHQHDPQNLNTISNNRIYAIIEDVRGSIWIGTKGGLNKYLPEENKFVHYTTSTHDFPNNVIMGVLEDNEGNIWVTTNRGISKFNPVEESNRNYDLRDGLQSYEFLVGSFLKTNEGEFIIGGINGYNAFYPQQIKDNPNIPSIIITGFQISNQETKLDTVVSEKKVIYLNHRQTDLSFNFVAIDYIFPAKNQYAYMLEGYDDDWVNCKFQRTAKYTNLRPKKYVFKVKGSNNDQVWNTEGTEIVIIIKPAFWQTMWFKISAPLFVILLALALVLFRIRELHKQKEHLKDEVNRQTKQIRTQNGVLTNQKEALQQQKEEIIAQRDEIEEQRDYVTSQRDKISDQKKDIEDSIIYAKRIQTAALPEADLMKRLLPEHFVLFRPRDIVSGDFYWAGEKDNKVIVVAADCTGHGVPGAFMSMLGISFLNKIVSEKSIIESNLILDRLRDNVIIALHQSVDNFEAKDGMDIALSVIDYDNQTLYFSGGNNPLYYVKNDEIIVYKGDKMPIAIYDYMEPFKHDEIKFEKGDTIYMFSDGYADQFGGIKGKKFMYKRFRDLLISMQDKKMDEQKEILNQSIEDWMSFPDKRHKTKSFSQIDDIVVIGVKL